METRKNITAEDITRCFCLLYHTVDLLITTRTLCYNTAFDIEQYYGINIVNYRKIRVYVGASDANNIK